MIEFDAQELTNLEHQLHAAIEYIEEASDVGATEDIVSLLKVGFSLGKAVAAIEAVADLVNQKLTEAKKKPLTKEEFDKKIYKSKVDPGLQALFEKSQASPCSSPCQSVMGNYSKTSNFEGITDPLYPSSWDSK